MLAVLGVSACGGAPEATSSPTVASASASFDPRALGDRPYVTAWGTAEVPANRKAHYFCATNLTHPEDSYCVATEQICRATNPVAVCEPHARAACIDAGRCFPTMATCERGRAVLAGDKSRPRLVVAGAPVGGSGDAAPSSGPKVAANPKNAPPPCIWTP